VLCEQNLETGVIFKRIEGKKDIMSAPFLVGPIELFSIIFLSNSLLH
jgi:hypothetical protein